MATSPRISPSLAILPSNFERWSPLPMSPKFTNYCLITQHFFCITSISLLWVVPWTIRNTCSNKLKKSSTWPFVTWLTTTSTMPSHFLSLGNEMSNGSLHLHHPPRLNDPPLIDVPLLLPPNDMIFLICHHHLLTLHLKWSSHAHHKRHQDIQWDKGKPPSVKLESVAAAIAENRDTILNSVLTFAVCTAMVKDT